jgi:long-chain acyl-CoA synthetase
MGLNVGQVLRQPALRTPDRVALVDVQPQGRSEITFAALDAMARRVATRLRAAGLGEGDRVQLVCGNGHPYVACWFGAMYAGCTVVPTPILSAAPEVAFRGRHARCRALVTDDPRRAMVEDARAGLPPDVRILSAEALAAEGSSRPDGPVELSAGAPAMVLYTSGTTGAPKGAVITHASLLTHTAALVHHTLGLDADARVMGALPLTHSYGIRMVVLATFYAGGRAVLIPRFRASQVMELLAHEGVTWLPAVPTMFAALAQCPKPEHAPATLRWCLSAGAPLTDDVRGRAEAILGAPIRQGYGLTEATFSTLDAPPAPPRPATVGRPVWGIEIRIADPAGHPLPPGQEGEIWVRGQNVMAGYLDDPSATAAVMPDGWMRSGDVGVLDPTGTLTVVDRLKDLIICGGNNVYPSEVEHVLSDHPAVSEVAVVGRPDDYYGEEVVAVIVPNQGAPLDLAELARWMRTRLARTKVPREVAVVDAMPLGASGKVLKRTLREMLASGRLNAEIIAPRRQPTHTAG